MDQLITIIVVLLFFVLPAVFKALLNKQQANQQQAGNKPQRPQADRTVQKEIEEFIRRAAGQQNQPQAGPAKAGQADAGQPRPPKKPRPKSKSQPTRAPAPPSKPAVVEAEAVEAEPDGSRVSRHVRKHLDAQEFQRRTARLGSEVALPDDKMEDHQQSVFEHKLGKLGRGSGRTIEAAAVPPTTSFELSGAAQMLASMLAHPDNLRQAIVLSEILQRPEHRWE